MSKVIKIIQPPIDYALVDPYIEQWVALTKDHKRVIAADKDVGKLMKKIDKMGIVKDQVVLHFVLDPNVSYSPTSFVTS